MLELQKDGSSSAKRCLSSEVYLRWVAFNVLAKFESKKLLNFVRCFAILLFCSPPISDDISKKHIVFENVPMLRQYFAGPEDPNFHLAVIKITSVEAMTPHSRLPEEISMV